MASDRIIFWINSPAQAIAGSSGADVLRGDPAGRSRLSGLGGADSLNSASGSDILIGGPGDDVYFVKGAGDAVVELAGEGADSVAASVSFALPPNVEDLTLLEAGQIDGVGNRLANTINGNSASNVLIGLAGADQLRGDEGDDFLDGGAGGDYLSGGAGEDVLIGGQGVDDLYGGSGADIFVFGRTDLGANGGLDRIGDFNPGEGDRIDLGAFAPPGRPNLAWIGTAAFSGRAAEVGYLSTGPGVFTVSADVDGDGVADLRFQVVSQRLEAGDFLLGGAAVSGRQPPRATPAIADEPGPSDLPPMVRLLAAQSELSGAGTAEVTIGLLEPQPGFSLSDLTVTHGQLSGLEALTPRTYRVLFTPEAGYKGPATVGVAPGAYARLADATVALAETAYQFFTGKTPTEAGLAYLVSSPANPTDLGDPYYAQFNLENRYINFAVNLGKQGEGRAAFEAQYGGLDMFETTRKAYQAIFGAAPTDAKVHELIDGRVDYFATYGQDGPAGLGTKAAAVGWLLAEAVKADVGVYATAVNVFLGRLAEGTAEHNIDLIGVYAPSGLGAFVG